MFGIDKIELRCLFKLWQFYVCVCFVWNFCSFFFYLNGLFLLMFVILLLDVSQKQIVIGCIKYNQDWFLCNWIIVNLLFENNF